MCLIQIVGDQEAAVDIRLDIGLRHGLINYKDNKTKCRIYTIHHTDSVLLGGDGGGGVLNCVGEHILKEFNTLFLTRFRTYKIPFTGKFF